MEDILNICIKSHIEDKISLTSLEKKYNISRYLIGKAIRKTGNIPINYQNSLKFNQNFFDNINTEEKAYWFGFVCGDGYISYNSYHFELSLQQSDLDHLIKFKKALQWENNIILSENRCRMCFANKHFHTTLYEKGCTPRKSLTFEFPQHIDSLFMNHFIRGLFDADGWITSKKNHAGVGILGTDSVIENIKKITKCEGTIYTDKRNSGIVKHFHIQKKENYIKFLNYIYKDANIYLERKFQKAAPFLRN